MRLKSTCAYAVHDEFSAHVFGVDDRTAIGFNGAKPVWTSPSEWKTLSVKGGFRWFDCDTCGKRTKHYAKGVWE